MTDGTEEPLGADDEALIETAIAEGVVTSLAQPLTGSLPPALLRCSPGEDGDARCLDRIGNALEFAAGAPAGSVQANNLRCIAVGGNAGECRYVPNVYRVNHRVDGVELVLSETDPAGGNADPFFTLLDDAGTCHGFRLGRPTPIACVHDGIFETTPPDRVGIRMCGDGLLTR